MPARTYTAQAQIDAPPAAVWATLVDLPGHRRWDPFTSMIRSRLVPGAAVWMLVWLGGVPVPQLQWVRRTTAPTELVWGMRLGPLLWAERVQSIRPDGLGGSVYTTADTIGGWLQPVVDRLCGRALEDGFGALVAGLRREAEQRASTPRPAPRPPGG